MKWLIIILFMFSIRCGGDSAENGETTSEETTDLSKEIALEDFKEEKPPETDLSAMPSEEQETALPPDSVTTHIVYACLKEGEDPVIYSYLQYTQNRVACSADPDQQCLCEIKVDIDESPKVIYYTATGARENCENHYFVNIKGGGTIGSTDIPNYTAEGYECSESILNRKYRYGY